MQISQTGSIIGILRWREKVVSFRLKIFSISIVALWATAVLLPLSLAWAQLANVAEAGILETLGRFDERFGTKDSIAFTFSVAGLSTIITLLLGVPLAFNLGRYSWPSHNLLRGLFAAPFVMPSILAAMGFLAIISFFDSVTDLGLRTNVAAQLLALLLAHAWFNLALIIRFMEPVLASVNPEMEAAARLLPAGRTRLLRMKTFWMPILAPSVMAAAVMTFVFSFTSFALVRHLTPGRQNLEMVMANQADWAGIQIPELGRSASEIVMAASLLQLLTMVFALGLISFLQSRARNNLKLSSLDCRIPATIKSWKTVHLSLMAGFIIAPLAGVLFGSFRIHSSEGFRWSLAGWQAAGVTTALPSALGWSLVYALVTLLISLPLGYVLAEIIHYYEQVGRPKLSLCIDVLVMLPLALSSVMIGLGVLIGLLRTDVEILNSWWIPAYGHLMMTTPFVVRIVLPSIRSIDPNLNAAAALLGASFTRRLLSIRLPLLIPPIIVAASLVVAISLGEFGASWVVVRFTEWTTLPVLIDDLLAKPGYNPLLRPAANAGGVVLMVITLLLFMAVERFRPIGKGGEF